MHLEEEIGRLEKATQSFNQEDKYYFQGSDYGHFPLW